MVELKYDVFEKILQETCTAHTLPTGSPRTVSTAEASRHIRGQEAGRGNFGPRGPTILIARLGRQKLKNTYY